MFETLSDLQKKAFAIKGMIPIACMFEEPGHYAYNTVPFYPEAYLQDSNNQAFNVEKGIVAFVADNVLYVIPKSKTVMDILVKERFVHKHSIAVPFANGELPWSNSQREQWENLLAEAKSGKV